jgi:ethanolamine utilization protein EutJ
MMDAVGKVVEVLNRPERWDFAGAQTLYAGVDLGTYKAIAIVVDERGVPRAASLRRAEIVRSGLILDYSGAQRLVREMLAEIRERSPLPIEKGATSYPPNTETANVDATKYILQGAGVEVLEVLDEPSAANLVLKVQNGAVVDVGGGTTGIAVIKNGRVAYSNDEATGGTHLTLVLAGHLRVSYEEAEKIKMDRRRSREILPIVRPVIDKISSIVETHLKKTKGEEEICLVGGTCELEGLPEIVARNLGSRVYRPEAPQVITPLGIALSCLGNGRGSREKIRNRQRSDRDD